MQSFLIVMFMGLFVYVGALKVGANIEAHRSTKISMKIDKKLTGKVMATILSFGLAVPQASFADFVDAPWSSGVKYEVVKKGAGEIPKVGTQVCFSS